MVAFFVFCIICGLYIFNFLISAFVDTDKPLTGQFWVIFMLISFQIVYCAELLVSFRPLWYICKEIKLPHSEGNKVQILCHFVDIFDAEWIWNTSNHLVFLPLASKLPFPSPPKNLHHLPEKFTLEKWT